MYLKLDCYTILYQTPDEDAGSEDDMLNDEDAEDDYEDGDFFDDDDDDVGGNFAGSDAGSVTCTCFKPSA